MHFQRVVVEAAAASRSQTQCREFRRGSSEALGSPASVAGSGPFSETTLEDPALGQEHEAAAWPLAVLRLQIDPGLPGCLQWGITAIALVDVGRLHLPPTDHEGKLVGSRRCGATAQRRFTTHLTNRSDTACRVPCCPCIKSTRECTTPFGVRCVSAKKWRVKSNNQNSQKPGRNTRIRVQPPPQKLPLLARSA